MKAPRWFTAASAALFVVAGLFATSVPAASARDSNCTTGNLDLYVKGNTVVSDNHSATYRVDNRIFSAVGVSPWTIQGGEIIMTVSGTPGVTARSHNYFQPGNISFKFNADETGVKEIRITTDYPGCNDGQPSPGSAHCGYYLLGRDGGVFSFGRARFFGSTGGIRLNKPVFGMSTTKSGNGYWLVADDGGVFSFGDARFYGSTGGIRLNQPITGMSTTKSGNGYWLVARDGGVFSFGDAQFHGSAGGMHISNAVGMITTQSGNGYWIITADARVFNFGDATNYGGGGQGIIVGGTAIGDGYRYVNDQGATFTRTSAGSSQTPAPTGFGSKVIGVANDPDSSGYWLADADGSVYPVGTTSYCGSLQGTHLNKPIVGFTAAGASS